MELIDRNGTRVTKPLWEDTGTLTITDDLKFQLQGAPMEGRCAETKTDLAMEADGLVCTGEKRKKNGIEEMA